MDSPHSLYKSTQNPSWSDLCPARNTCNWERGPLENVRGRILQKVSFVFIYVHQMKKASPLWTEWCWQINLWLLLSELHIISSLVFGLPFSLDSSHPAFLSGEISPSIERAERCVLCGIQSRKPGKGLWEISDAYPNVIQHAAEIDLQ